MKNTIPMITARLTVAGLLAVATFVSVEQKTFAQSSSDPVHAAHVAAASNHPRVQTVEAQEAELNARIERIEAILQQAAQSAPGAMPMGAGNSPRAGTIPYMGSGAKSAKGMDEMNMMGATQGGSVGGPAVVDQLAVLRAKMQRLEATVQRQHGSTSAANHANPNMDDLPSSGAMPMGSKPGMGSGTKPMQEEMGGMAGMGGMGGMSDMSDMSDMGGMGGMGGMESDKKSMQGGMAGMGSGKKPMRKGMAGMGSGKKPMRKGMAGMGGGAKSASGKMPKMDGNGEMVMMMGKMDNMMGMMGKMMSMGGDAPGAVMPTAGGTSKTMGSSAMPAGAPPARMNGGGMGMGMDEMEMAGMMGMVAMPQSSLPGYPGVSHLNHIGATGFFLDHPQHIALSTQQKTMLYQIKEQAALDRASASRSVQEAEQDIWKLTAADQLCNDQIEAKVTALEKIKGDARLRFISSIGAASRILTDEQRKILTGFSPPIPTLTPAAAPMAGGMKDM